MRPLRREAVRVPRAARFASVSRRVGVRTSRTEAVALHPSIMREMSISQRVRVVLARLQATGHERPVTWDQIRRELPDENEADLRAAIQQLIDARLAQVRGDGWATRPPPTGTDATLARANASRLHPR